MADEFINPNWHVVFLHYPIALLTAGIIGEIIGYFRPRGGLRTASRWMILIGGLLAIPTALLGLYAFRDTVVAGVAEPNLKWYQIVARSIWSEAQWQFMWDHLVYNLLAVIVTLGVIVAWIGCAERTRRRYYCPMLTLLVGSLVLMSFGAWHGGEAVYRMGTAVETAEPQIQAIAAEHDERGGDDQSIAEEIDVSNVPPRMTPAPHVAHHEHANVGRTEEVSAPSRAAYYLSPLQLHLLFAGLMIAPAIVALGLIFRRGQELTLRPNGNTHGIGPAVEVTARTAFFHSRGLWFAVLGFGFAAAVAGAWSVMGSLFSAVGWQSNWAELQEWSHRRLTAHAIVGPVLLVTSLALGLLAWFAPNRKKIAGTLAVVFFAALAIQAWLGIAMLFDSHEGPLTNFNEDIAEQPESVERMPLG